MQIILLAGPEPAEAFDWTKLIGLIGIPAAIVAVLGIAAYFVGFIHPIAVRAPTYWYDGPGTRVKVAIKNRSLLWDRNVDRIVMYRIPRFAKRAVKWNWRKQAQAADFAPWGIALPTPDNPIKLSKRENRSFEFELRTPNREVAKLQLDGGVRIEAKSGHQRSRSEKINFTKI